MRDQLLKSIIEIKDKKTNSTIPIIKKELKWESSKYSSLPNPIWHVFINDCKLKKTSEYVIVYKCLTCDQLNSVSTTQFLRKIRNDKTNCFQCTNITSYHKDSSSPLCVETVVKEALSYPTKHQNSIQEFELYPDVFKHAYTLSHLSTEDYNRIKPNILSFGNGKYTDIQNYEYYSIYKVHNQMRFSSVLYDNVNCCIFKENQPIMKCDSCEKSWRCKSLVSFKNCYKILCPSCKLCNRTFKIRSTKNIENRLLMYQSKLELKFIEWCNFHNILVCNGPSIEYRFHDKTKQYRVDFQIEDILIEIKDFHIWHKNQVDSGIWDAKVEAMNNSIKESKYKCFLLITPRNWEQSLCEIIDRLQIK